MYRYRRILAVVDLREDSLIVTRRAQAIAQATPDAQLHLLHVVEYLPVEPLGDALLPVVQLETHMIDKARLRLDELAAQLEGVPPQIRIESGNIKGEILRVSRELQTDLIVIGAHERHGLSILVNLTEDTVLHGASCDVLAVRLPGPVRL
jgi:universal stress protein A